MLNKPIFIVGSHKSGTSLLRSLLDGHDKLFVLPRETHFFQYSGFWVDYCLRRSWPQNYSWDNVLKNFTSLLIEQNKINLPYSDNPYFQGYNINRFLQYLKQLNPKTKAEAFEFYLKAIFYSLAGCPPNNSIRFVEKSVESAEYASIIQRMFPDCSFIHIVRNPYATIVAIRKSASHNRYPNMYRIVFSLYNSYYYLYKNRLSIDRYLVIKYEDLVSETDRVMGKICSFLGIKFENIMLKPTYQKNIWKGNSSSGKPFSGVSIDPLSNWKSELNHLETAIANRVFHPVIKEFKYEFISNNRPIFFPVRGENIISYFKNRYLYSIWN